MAQKRPFPFNDLKDKDLQCPVCLKTYAKPKILPCSHTFCNQCLTTICNDDDDDDYYGYNDEIKRLCPLCRTEFSIPAGGVKLLPDNDFIQRRVLEKELSKVKQKLCICDPCVKRGINVKAEWYCIDCKDNLCEPCQWGHQVIKDYTKLHKVVTLTLKPTEEELDTVRVDCCQEHKKEIEFYCSDCDQILCCICLFPEHNKHDFRPKQSVSDSKKEQAAKDRINIEKCWKAVDNRLKDLSDKEKTILSNLTDVRQSIHASYDKLVNTIISHKTELLVRVDEVEKEQMNRIRAREDRFQQHAEEFSSFLEYSITEMKGESDGEIIRVADNIHKRAEKLVQWHEQYQQDKHYLPIKPLEIKFVPSHDPIMLSSEDLTKLTGNLDVTITEDLASELINGNTTVEYINHEKNVAGVTIVDDQIFVVESQQSYINVYNSRTLLPQRRIKVPDLKNATSLAGCSHNKALYISDPDLRCIHRIKLNDNFVKCFNYSTFDTWEWTPLGLSVTPENNLLVTSTIRDPSDDYEENKLIEFGIDGEILWEMEFDEDWKNINQTVRLSRERFIVCLNSDQLSLKIIGLHGRELSSTDIGEKRSEGNLYQPSCMSLDSTNTFLFVTDQWNNRILIFSSALTPLGQVHCKDLKYPSSLCFDSNNNQLIVCEISSGRVLVIRRAES